MPDTPQALLSVRTLDDDGFARWDAFVNDCPQATFFHRAGWKRIIEATLGHRCYFLYAERDGRIVGVLPLTHIRSRIFGSSLVSCGFCVYGGPAVVDERTRAALDDRAIDLARSLGVDHLEYRSLSRRHDDRPCNDTLYATFRKPIDPDPEKNLLAVPRKQRAVIRKGLKSGLVAVRDDDIGDFCAVYGESLRNLGTPVLPRSYFAALRTVFGADCEILTVHDARQPVSTVISFYFRDEVLPYYGGGRPAARDVAAFDFMYWEVMRHAAERGLRLFDFGRSKAGTGSFAFKKNWGFAPQPLHYEFKLFKGTELPSINPLNPKYRLFIAAWQRLPMAVASRVGPFFARQLG